MPGVISPTSSRNSVPPSACSNTPRRSRNCAGECPSLVTEWFGLKQGFADRRTVDGDEGRASSNIAVPMKNLGHPRLANARFARDQDRIGPLRDHRQQFLDSPRSPGDSEVRQRTPETSGNSTSGLPLGHVATRTDKIRCLIGIKSGEDALNEYQSRTWGCGGVVVNRVEESIESGSSWRCASARTLPDLPNGPIATA